MNVLITISKLNYNMLRSAVNFVGFLPATDDNMDIVDTVFGYSLAELNKELESLNIQAASFAINNDDDLICWDDQDNEFVLEGKNI